MAVSFLFLFISLFYFFILHDVYIFIRRLFIIYFLARKGDPFTTPFAAAGVLTLARFHTRPPRPRLSETQRLTPASAPCVLFFQDVMDDYREKKKRRKPDPPEVVLDPQCLRWKPYVATTSPAT